MQEAAAPGLRRSTLTEIVFLIDNNLEYSRTSYNRIVDETTPLLNDVLLIDENGVILQATISDYKGKLLNELMEEDMQVTG